MIGSWLAKLWNRSFAVAVSSRKSSWIKVAFFIGSLHSPAAILVLGSAVKSAPLGCQGAGRPPSLKPNQRGRHAMNARTGRRRSRRILRVREGPNQEAEDGGTSIRTQVHAPRRSHGGAARAHPAGRPRPRSRPRRGGLALLRARDRRRLHPALGRAPPFGSRRAARGDARPGRQHARSAKAIRSLARHA